MNRRPREDVLVRRTMMVEAIPSGAPIELQAGQLAQITQALGSSFTLLVEGQLVRLRGSDADAIGKTDPTPVIDHGDVQASDVEPLVWEALRTCYDPEIPINIVDLGLVYRCELRPFTEEEGKLHVVIDMTLTAPGCPVAGEMPGWVEIAVGAVEGVSGVEVKMTFDPPWTPDRMSEEAQVAVGWY